jgi:tetratricopeptide (TPR) repeat protein
MASEGSAVEALLIFVNQALFAGDFTEAGRRLHQAHSLDPVNPRIWALHIDSLWVEDRPHEALQLWLQAEQQLAETDLSYLSLGNIQRDLNAFEASEAAYERAMALAGSTGEHKVAWNRSQNLIGLERYSLAYAIAEQRLLIDDQPWRPAPYWQGWPPEGNGAALESAPPRAITVWTEQGLGDTLQYLRWLPVLLPKVQALRLEVDPPLLPLLRQGLAWLGPSLNVVPKGISPTPAPVTCQGSLLSLPWLLGGAPLPQAFGPNCSGYLRSDQWPAAEPRRGRAPRIGLVWASGRKQDHPFIRREYERRSLPAANLVTLLEGLSQTGAELVCLQYGVDRQRADGWGGAFTATLADGVSLADNARWIAGLDLVITVDTATAHLVGAMAVPGWVLLPWASDPRWLRDRTDSPWYPTLSLLRQPRHQDWEGLVQGVLQRFRLWREHFDREGLAGP